MGFNSGFKGLKCKFKKVHGRAWGEGVGEGEGRMMWPTQVAEYKGSKINIKKKYISYSVLNKI